MPTIAAVVADDGRRLGEVEALALGQSLDDVDEDDVGEAGLGDSLGGGGADVAGAHDGDLVAGHGRLRFLDAGETNSRCDAGGSAPARLGPAGRSG